MPPTIDVLIVTTRARDLVLSCLEHFALQTVPHTIYLADNASNEDGTTDAVRERYPDVRITTMGGNRGFGKAMNQLAAEGSGEIVVLANDDMDVEPQFLEKLVEPFADEAVGMVAGMTLQPGDGNLVDGFGVALDPGFMPYNRLRHRHPSDAPEHLLGPSGGAAAYRRVAWEAAGGYDPRFFVYGEDVDMALRLRLAGWRAADAAGARGVHLGGATTGLDSPFQRRNSGFARGFLLRRYGVLRSRHAPRALAVDVLTVLWGLVRFRTALPLKARVDGWRAAGRTSGLAIPADALDERITLRECLRRLRHER